MLLPIGLGSLGIFCFVCTFTLLLLVLFGLESEASVGKRIQYVFVDADGPVMRCHQDDMEDPVVAGTLAGCIDVAADVADTDTTGLFEAMVENGSGYEGCYFIREEIETFDLSPEESAEVEAIKERAFRRSAAIRANPAAALESDEDDDN